MELLKSEIEDIGDSVDVMIERRHRILLENIPSTEEDRKKLDKYKQMRENFRKVMIEL